MERQKSHKKPPSLLLSREDPWIAGSAQLQRSEEAERAVLACVLLEPSFWPQVEQALNPDDFAFDRHRCIFEGMAAVVRQDQVIDTLTLQAKLAEQGTLETAGGVAYISCLDVDLPDPTRIRAYLEIVQDRSLRRRLLDLGLRIGRGSLQEGSSGREALASAAMALQKLEGRVDTGQVEPLGNAAAEVLEKLEAGLSKTQVMSTGIPDLDGMTGGLVRGTLTVIAGRPGTGKTSLALSIARDLSLQQKRRVVFFSLEMSPEELALRVLSAESDIPFQRIVGGVLSHSQWSRLRQAAETVQVSRLLVADSPTLSVEDVNTRVPSLCWQQPIDALFIDYLQLMYSEAFHPTESRELGTITRSLKHLARRMDIPVILLSQLSRESVRRGRDSRPVLSDLRGSGNIEEHADLVIFSWPPECPEAAGDGNVVLIVAKHRNGSTGDVPVAFVREFMDFRPSSAELEGSDNYE